MKVTVGPTNNVVFQPSTDRGGSPAQINLTTNTSSRVVISEGGSSSAAGMEAYAAANAAANTVRVSANSLSTINKANGINFVNTSSIFVNVESGIDGNANVSFSTGGASVTDAYNQANAARDQANTSRTTANNAYNTANLKLNIAGGEITGSLNIAGNLVVSGNTTYINVTTYSVEDSLIYLAANNKTGDNVDIGFIGGKNANGVYSHTGLARDATDGTWHLFDGLSDEAHENNVIDFANTTLATLRANINANSIVLAGNAVATQANLTLAYNQANAAYDDSNTRVLKAGDTVTGNLNVSAWLITQNVIPSDNNISSLGTPTNRFKDLYLSNSTLYIGDTIISSVEGEVQSNTFNASVSFISGGLNVLDQANNARTTANDAYNSANNRVLRSGDTMTGTLNINFSGVGLNVNSQAQFSNTINVTNSVSTNAVNFGFGVYELTSNTFQTTLNTTIEVDSFSSSTYSTVKYIVQVKTGTSLHSTELFCIQDGVSTYMTEYATLISGPPLGNFSIDLAGGRMRLNFTPDNPLGNILTFRVVRYTIAS